MILATSSTSIFCCMVRGVGLFYSQFIKGYFSTNSFAVSLCDIYIVQNCGKRKIKPSLEFVSKNVIEL